MADDAAGSLSAAEPPAFVALDKVATGVEEGIALIGLLKTNAASQHTAYGNDFGGPAATYFGQLCEPFTILGGRLVI
jgi:hypothetical protein